MRFVVALVFSGLVLGACEPPDPPVPTTVTVSPTTAAFTSVGETQQFTATVLDQNGNAIANPTVTWASSDISVVNVDASGLATSSGNGTATVSATADAASGSASITVDQAAAQLVIVTGDGQTGEVGEPLPVNPAVEVRDALGAVVVGKSVAFQAGAGSGSVGSSSVQTGITGRASTSWTLGTTVGSQTMTASIGGESVTFNATGEVGLLRVATTALARARATLAYNEALMASGGTGTGYMWSVVGGNLPAGLNVSTSGDVSGSPTTPGAFTATFQVQDGAGATATRALTINVCDAPLSMAIGAVSVADASTFTTCGFYLPSGAGDAYRVTLHRPLASTSPGTVPVSLTMAGDGVVASPPVLSSAGQARQQILGAAQARRFQRDVMRAEATERAHLALREAENRLIRTLPRSGLKPRQGPRLRAANETFRAAPDTAVFNVPTDASTCDLSTAESNTAVKLAETQNMVLYQSVAERGGSDEISTSTANMLLQYFDDYGTETIQKFFGGTTDINGDGQITVLATPDIGAQVAAFVWSGDFFENTPTVCPASNVQELVYFSASVINNMDMTLPEDDRSYQALATLVHEVKHVSSLYNRIASGASSPFHPSFVEEGTAEIAGEVSSRLAWAATGGPPVGSRVTRQSFLDAANSTEVTPENYGIFLRMARVVWYLSSQPNGVSASPGSQQTGIYGSGWLFHRFLGDSYGGAASALADQSLFLQQNDSMTAAGFSGYPVVAGKSYADLLKEFAIAVTLAGTGIAPASDFTTYDFSTTTEVFSNPDPSGTFPWPVTRTCNGVACPTATTPPATGDNDDGVVTAAQFGDRTYVGSLGPGGLRVHEFESNGSGIGAEFDVSALSGVDVIIARIR